MFPSAWYLMLVFWQGVAAFHLEDQLHGGKKVRPLRHDDI